jgi:predicted acyl esterase
VYETDVLSNDLTLAGPILADLVVSTSGTDSDWIVKVIDVYPNDHPDPSPNPADVRMGGYQQLVGGEVMRSRFRNSFEKPEPFALGKPAAVKFKLPDVCHTFRRGHKVMVQIRAPGSRWWTAIRNRSWTLLLQRNPTSGKRRSECIGRRNPLLESWFK